METVYGYDDYWGWGRLLVDAARRRGLSAAVFQEPDQVQAGALAFMHLAHMPIPQRARDKAIAEELARIDSLRLIPTLCECRLYDDKVAQAELLSDWLPPTWVVRDPAAIHSITDEIGYPFVSKSAEGASGKNVRLVNSYSEGKQEAELAFNGDGIQRFDGGYQHGYLLWQQYVEHAPTLWRVILIARRYGMVIERRSMFHELPDGYAESFIHPITGNREVWNCRDDLTVDTESVLNFARSLCMKFDFQYVVADIIGTHQTKLYLLETSCGFSLPTRKRDQDFRFFESREGDWIDSGFRLREMFDLIVHCHVEQLFI